MTPPDIPLGLQQSPDRTWDFATNGQPCPQTCSTSSVSQLSPDAVFPQSRPIYLSVSAPVGIICFSILSLLFQSRWEGYWAGSDQDRELLSVPRAIWTPHCLHGDKTQEAGIPGHCTAPSWCLSSIPPGKPSVLRMPQAPPGRQCTHGWRRCGQRMGSVHG